MSDADFEEARMRHLLTPEKRASLRRQAVQLAIQLPDDKISALYVLDSTRAVLLNFLERELEPAPTPLRLVSPGDD